MHCDIEVVYQGCEKPRDANFNGLMNNINFDKCWLYFDPFSIRSIGPSKVTSSASFPDQVMKAIHTSHRKLWPFRPDLALRMIN